MTGAAELTLFVASTHSDGAFFAYLEDVEPSGRVLYITEGCLRALHREQAPGSDPYGQVVDSPNFRAADAQPLAPGVTTELRIQLLPTSVLLRKGHRLRVAVAGADDGLFARVPASGDPVITVFRGGRNASRMSLPVIRR